MRPANGSRGTGVVRIELALHGNVSPGGKGVAFAPGAHAYFKFFKRLAQTRFEVRVGLADRIAKHGCKLQVERARDVMSKKFAPQGRDAIIAGYVTGWVVIPGIFKRPMIDDYLVCGELRFKRRKDLRIQRILDHQMRVRLQHNTGYACI